MDPILDSPLLRSAAKILFVFFLFEMCRVLFMMMIESDWFRRRFK